MPPELAGNVKDVVPQLVTTLVSKYQCPEYEPLLYEFCTILVEDAELFTKKQLDYGPGNIAATGEVGVLIRCLDKVNRLLNLWRSTRGPANEATNDTWQDHSIYGVIARLWRRKKWPGWQPGMGIGADNAVEVDRAA